MSDFNDKIIAEFRANSGRVDSAGFGTNLVLLHTRGAKTGLPGQPRHVPARRGRLAGRRVSNGRSQ